MRAKKCSNSGRSIGCGPYIPDLPGVIALASTREEVEVEIREAVSFHIEGLQDEGFPVPAPSSEAGVLAVYFVA